jgi:hypothetical protein
MTGSAELKEYSDFFKELDKIHKDSFEDLKKQYNWNCFSSKDQQQITSLDSIEENVFIDE